MALFVAIEEYLYSLDNATMLIAQALICFLKNRYCERSQ